MFAASSREIEDACLTAPAIPRGAATWQDRPAAIPEVRILVEKSAPFPRQSHARDAVLCEIFMLCLWHRYGRYVSLLARLGQSRENNQLSVPIQRGRVYHGESWRVSFEMVQLADKQS